MINNVNWLRRLTSGIVCLGLTVAATTAPAAAHGTAELQQNLDALVAVDGMTGAVVRQQDRHGTNKSLSAGSAERDSGRPMVDGRARYRVGSLTKPVVAVTVLTLVQDGLVDLSAPVERYLPGQLRDSGDGADIDGRRITIRQLLQQISGLPEFSDAVDEGDGPFTPEELLEYALHRTPVGDPGERFFYANTNYLVLGMVINAVTGQDFRDAVIARVLGPLAMADSYWPLPGEVGIRGDHAHTYAVDPEHPEAGPVDATELNGHALGASGGLISSPADMDRFWQGMFGGELLRPASLRAMTSNTVSVGDPSWPDTAGDP